MITLHPNFYLQSKQKRAKDIAKCQTIIVTFCLNLSPNYSEKVCASNVFPRRVKASILITRPRDFVLSRDMINEILSILVRGPAYNTLGWPTIGQLCDYRCIIKRGQSVFRKVDQPLGRRPRQRTTMGGAHTANGVSRW